MLFCPCDPPLVREPRDDMGDARLCTRLSGAATHQAQAPANCLRTKYNPKRNWAVLSIVARPRWLRRTGSRAPQKMAAVYR